MSLSKTIKALHTNLEVTPRLEPWLAQTGGNILFSEATAQWVKEQLSTPQRERRLHFSASSIHTCPRAQMFRYLGMPEKSTITTDTALIFSHGSWSHLKWQVMLLEAGILAEAEVSCRHDSYNLRGTIDGILDSGHGWELKTINSLGFKNVLQNGPKPEHLFQIHAYMVMTGIDIWSLIYEEKNTQQYKEFMVSMDTGIADQVRLLMDLFAQSQEAQVLPDIRPDCQQGKGTTFKQCAYSSMCLTAGDWPQRRIKVGK